MLTVLFQNYDDGSDDEVVGILAIDMPRNEFDQVVNDFNKAVAVEAFRSLDREWTDPRDDADSTGYTREGKLPPDERKRRMDHILVTRKKVGVSQVWANNYQTHLYNFLVKGYPKTVKTVDYIHMLGAE